MTIPLGRTRTVSYLIKLICREELDMLETGLNLVATKVGAAMMT